MLVQNWRDPHKVALTQARATCGGIAQKGLTMSALAFQLSSEANVKGSGRRMPIAILFGAVCAMIGAWLIAYSTGYAPWLGFANQSEAYVGERIRPKGVSIGPRTFAFVKGQRVFVSYNLHKADQGALAVRVIQRGDLTQDPRATLTLSRTGKGRHEYRVPEAGLYTIALHCVAQNDACDVGYNATWGGLPASDTLTLSALDEAALGTWAAVE